MRRAERLTAILERMAGNGSVDVTELTAALGVSSATVRRDLQTLSQQKLLVRTHGGALAHGVAEELPVRLRGVRRQAEKRRIGQAAAALVEDGAVIGLTGGSTAMEVARALVGRNGITVVTNAVDIAAELVVRRNLRLVVIGGVARHESYELVGAAAEAMLSNYHLDVAFTGVDGLHPDEGCTTHDEMEAHTDLAFINRARRNIVIADSSKIGKVTFAQICPVSSVTEVVTDRDADPRRLQTLRDAGLRVTAV